tara:strand:+ start:305 stop:565 length:261 start_codon:yes stop_codon:yes gene_type:complete
LYVSLSLGIRKENINPAIKNVNAIKEGFNINRVEKGYNKLKKASKDNSILAKNPTLNSNAFVPLAILPLFKIISVDIRGIAKRKDN